MPQYLIGLLLLIAVVRAAESPDRLLSQCGITWETPSRDALDSMPLSGWRGAGANVWFSEGALRLYLGHSGAYDADEVLRKIGALTLRVPGLDLHKPKLFRQELDLSRGAIRVSLTAEDGTTLAYRLQFCGESLLIDAKSSRPMRIEVAYGNWRALPQPNGEASVEVIEGTLVAAHRNRGGLRSARLASEQKVPDKTILNPSLGRVFGCAIAASGGISWNRPRAVQSAAWQGAEWPGLTVESKQHLIAVTLGAAPKGDPAAWLARSKLLLETDVLTAVRTAADQRWEDFWRRSYIYVQPGGKTSDPAFQLGRNYQLFRYMLASSQEAELPMRTNGGIFTMESTPDRIAPRLNNPELALPKSSGPDFRRGNLAFTGRSQRWVGWPGVASGDFDITASTLRFYRERLGIAQARAAGLKAAGAVYPEQLSLGGYVSEQGNAQGLSTLPYQTYHFSSGLEIAWMALQSHLTNGADLRPELPWILGQLRFFESYYRAQNLARTGNELDAEGHIVIQPANGLELTAGAINPAETVAALRALCAGLLESKQVERGDRDFVESLASRLPELPMAQSKGFEVLSPAAKWREFINGWELPELYAAWPYRLVGVTQPETLQMSRATWNLLDEPRGKTRQGICHKQDLSWQPTWVTSAALGMTKEAEKRAIAKLSDAASPCRFPAFFGPGHEWLPDYSWGGSAMVGLQEMLLAPQASARGKIRLLPAWPKQWDVVFKLRAPGNTTVEGEVAGGKLVRLIVSPDERYGDVELPDGWNLPERR